jgi:hypothetical protein
LSIEYTEKIIFVHKEHRLPIKRNLSELFPPVYCNTKYKHFVIWMFSLNTIHTAMPNDSSIPSCAGSWCHLIINIHVDRTLSFYCYLLGLLFVFANIHHDRSASLGPLSERVHLFLFHLQLIPEFQFYEHPHDDIHNYVFYSYHYEPETEVETFNFFQSIFNDNLITLCVRYLQGIS